MGVAKCGDWICRRDRDVKFLLLNSAASLKLLLEINLARHTATHLECLCLVNGGRRARSGQLQSESEATLGYMEPCFKDKMFYPLGRRLSIKCLKPEISQHGDGNTTLKRQRQEGPGLAKQLIQPTSKFGVH